MMRDAAAGHRARRAASSSSGFTNDPVGLFGLTIRSARVRGVSAPSTLAKSIVHRPWYSRSYGTAVTRPGRVR